MTRNSAPWWSFVFLGLLTLAMLPAAASAQKRPSAYFCPMDAGVTANAPGACPVCGMELVKRRTAKAEKDPVRTSELSPGAPVFEKKLKNWMVRVFLAAAQDTGSLRTVRIDVFTGRKGTPISDAEVWFHAVYPSGRNIMPLCKWNGAGYEGAIDLPQKGVYTMMVHVNRSEDRRALTFRYEQ